MGKLTYGLFVTILGMGTVFLTLLALVAVLNIMKVAAGQKKQEKKPFSTEEVLTEEQSITDDAPDDDMDDEITAVIAAAIAATLKQPAHCFLVRSITRISPNTPSWSREGRREHIMNHW
ncbi:MAG: OadG family transporter subunit [Clostridia bacterium]